MTEQPSVLVAGSINVDITVRADRLPAPGETVAGGRLERAGGGKGANQAVAAARAGAAVSLVGAVGDDDLGADALAALRAEGVDVTAVARLAGVATGVALIVVDGDGAQPDRGRVGREPRGDRRARPLRRAPPTGLRARELRAARRAGPRGRPARARGRLRAGGEPGAGARPRSRAVRAAPDPHAEPARGGGADRRAGARGRGARARRAHRCAGDRHAGRARRAARRRGRLRAGRAAPAVRAVDTTGAGDSFNGVLAAELARGRELPAAVVAAVAAAAGSVTRPGARG